MSLSAYLPALEISFRRIRVGLIWFTLGIFIAARVLSPMKLSIIDCTLGLPMALFATWLGGRLFSEDAGDVDEGWLRTLPVHPSTMFAARAALGLLLIVLMSTVQALSFSSIQLGNFTIGNTDRLLFGPSDHSLHFAYLFALFACTAWLARGITYATDSKYSGWWAIMLVSAFAFQELLLRLGFHALIEPGLWLMAVVGVVAAARASARRDVDLHAHSRSQAPVRGWDLLLAGAAHVLLVTLPFTIILGCIVKVVFRTAPLLESFVAILLFVGVMPAVLALVRARKERLPMGHTLGSTLLSLSVIGWGIEWLSREPKRNTYWIGPWPWPRNSGGPQLVGAGILGVVLVWFGAHRPFQQWVVRSTDKGEPFSIVEWRLDGKPMGLRESSGWRLGWDEFTNPLMFSQGMVHHDADPDGEFANYAIEIPSGRWTAHIGDRSLKIDAVNHTYSRFLLQRTGVAGVLVYTENIEKEVERAIHDLVVHKDPRKTFDAIGDMGPGGWILARRNVGTRYLWPKNGVYGWSESTDSQESIREQLLSDLIEMLPMYYGPLHKTSTFDAVLADFKLRREGAGRLHVSHWNEELHRHFKSTEPCLRAFAGMTGDARKRFDRWLASGDPHAALAAGLRGEEQDFDLIEKFLHRRMGHRGVIAGGLKELDTDQVALAFGWALFAIDRGRATEAIIAMLGQPDPLAAELLVMAGPRFETAMYAKAPDLHLAQAWRLPTEDKVNQLRARIKRALLSMDITPLEYMDQAPGFGAMVHN